MLQGGRYREDELSGKEDPHEIERLYNQLPFVLPHSLPESERIRGLRLMLEYYKVDEILRKWQIMSTIVIFGSARVDENGPGSQSRWYNEARSFAKLASKEGGAVCDVGGERHNVITTGGGPGIMEAANRGAYEVGAPSIGFHVKLIYEEHPNPYTTPDLTFTFHYFALRKLHLALRANAFVAFPGGLGTIDELFELLTLAQTGKMPRVPVLLVDREYWEKAVNFEYLFKTNMIDEKDLSLVQYVETGDAAWDLLKKTNIPQEVRFSSS